MFDRLVGLETEYAVRFVPDEPRHAAWSQERLFRALLKEIGRRLPTAEARNLKPGAFTANGGAVWFEAARFVDGKGLIEGSTPECRGPRQVLLYQRAQDRLIAESARDADVPGVFCLVKNDRDSRGNVYGAQENYELEIAGGAWLAAWRIGLVLLLPAIVLGELVVWLVLAACLLYLVTAGTIYLVAGFFLGGRWRRLMLLVLFGREVADGNQEAAPFPKWLEVFAVGGGLRLGNAPLAAGLWLLAWGIAFRRVRRLLLPHLLSRCLIGGSGSIDDAGRFHLAEKGSAMNCRLAFTGLVGDRPIFGIGHLLKPIAFRPWVRPADYFRLFARRQRLQIGLGDSNMAEEAELLRVGTTLLVLDAIEAGALPQLPRVLRPIRALRKLLADPTLSASVRLSDGRRMTAIELQRFHLDACRRFVERRADDGDADRIAEARDVLDRWEDVLDALEQGEAERLVGRIDWITKRFLLQQAGEHAAWPERKKIDIRYHELSPEGYFARLQSAGVGQPLCEDEAIERAIRNPPPDTPASARGRYIREFADGSQALQADWNSLYVARGRRWRAIDLHRFGTRDRDAPGSAEA